MYARVNCTVHNKGWLVKADEIEEFHQSHIEKNQADAIKDWYVSPFLYEDKAFDYYKSEIKDDNGKVKKARNSMAGYSGECWPYMLYWDIDCEGDIKKSQKNTIKLVDYLSEIDLLDSTDVYFSGRKGFHITVQLAQKIDQATLLKIVRGVAADAGVDKSVFDTSVYNITRLLRMENTKHEKSGLFKIPLTFDELYDLNPSEILELAKSTRELEGGEPTTIKDLVDKYNIPDKEYVVDESVRDKFEVLNEFNDLVQSSERRRCIQLMEDGEFGPGDRNSAIVRLAAYYKHENLDEVEAHERINSALQKRSEKYPESNPVDDKETEATLRHVYSPKWTGGIFSCKKDEFLQKVCSQGGNCCMMPKTNALGKNVQDIGGLFKSYVLYGNEADEDWPEFGLSNLDSLVRVRPRNYSIVAGANGCVDADTEFMSRTGWKKIADWDGEEVLQFNPENGEANFQKPIDYIKLPCDEFYHFKTKYGLDQMLSEEHTVLFYSNSKTHRTASMKEVYTQHVSSKYGFRGKFKTSFILNDNSSLDLSNEMIRVMVAVIADGTFNRNTNTCTVRLKKDTKKQRLKSLLNDASISFTETECNGEVKGFHRYVFQAPWREKRYGQHWYSASSAQLKVITDEVLHWDGYKNTFSTCIKESADFIQYAFSATGRRASISTQDRVGEKIGGYIRKSVEYTVIVASSEFTSMAGNAEGRGVLPINKVKSEDGFKYCFTMPSGFLVLRRNNKVFTTGNSGKTSLILEMMDRLNQQKIPHLFFSLDMADSSLFEKLAAKYTQYDIKDIERVFASTTRKTGIMREVGEILKEQLPYTYFDFTSSVNMSYIKESILNLNKDLPDNESIKVVFVDYAGRLSGDGDSQYLNATSNALAANDTAKETNTHMMIIAQIGRLHGDHTTPIHNNRVAKESGAWEENATFVMTVWRPFGKGTEGVPDNAMVTYIGKNRTGRLGECYFTWNGKKGKIEPMDEIQIEEYSKNCDILGLEPPPDYLRSKKNSDKRSSRIGKRGKYED